MTTDAGALFAAAPAAASAAPAAAPAPGETGAAPAAAPAALAANGAWYDTFENVEVKNWTAAKGFKDPAAVAESALNLEKLIGHDKAGRTVVIPKDDATPAEIAAFNSKLGVPETADGYKLPLPEGSDPKLATTIQGWMHKAGATPKVAEALTKEFVAFSAAQQQEQQAALIASSNKALGEAQAAWGSDAPRNLGLAKTFAATMIPAEVTLDSGEKVSRADFMEKVFNSTGATRAMVELFSKAGQGMGEHQMVTGQGSGIGGAMSPAAAQAQIAALKSDKAWTKSYLEGDAAKKAQMTKLQEQAYPEQR